MFTAHAALCRLSLAAGILAASICGSAATQSVNIAVIGSPAVIHGGFFPASGADLPGMAFTDIAPAAVTPTILAAFDTVVLNVSSVEVNCHAAALPAAVRSALSGFATSAGHKLIVIDSGCTPQDYSWLPFPFTTNNPGAQGAQGTLTVVEENALSSTNATSLSFINTSLVATETDSVGDANVVPHFSLVGYAANLNVGDSVVNLTNTGYQSTTTGELANLCINVYAFSPDEQMIACCSCTVTPNALASISVRSNLIDNTLTPAMPGTVTIKLVPTAGAVCNASAVRIENLATGAAAWGTTLHAGPAGNYVVTETPFVRTALGATEITRIAALCGFIQSNGSGFGICRSCRAGALGAPRR